MGKTSDVAEGVGQVIIVPLEISLHQDLLIHYNQYTTNRLLLDLAGI